MRKIVKVSFVVFLVYILTVYNSGGFENGLFNGSVTAKSSVSFVKPQNPEKYKNQELIVKYVTNAKDKEFTNKKLKAVITEKSLSLGVEKVRLPKDVSINEAIKAYKDDPNVEYVHPNYTYQQTSTPNDPYYIYQWNLPNVKAEEAWNISQGLAEVTVAIIDTGVDLNHPDLKANLLSGWNFVAANNLPQDDNGHGTHVAGIAAGVTNNSLGIAGLAGKVKIMPVKVLNSEGNGYDWDVAEGIKYAADNGADIINLSLAGPSFSSTLQNAVDYAYNKGVLVIAAAGNEGLNSVGYPAKYSSVMAVSATDQNNYLANFSNYGPEIEVSAPGVQILSTYWYNGNSEYAWADGTSMASPMVAGLAALILSSDVTLTNSEVRQIINSTADDLGIAGFDSQYGNGKINAYQAVYQAANRTANEPPKLSLSSPVEGTLTNQAVVEVKGTAYGADIVRVQGQDVVPIGDGFFTVKVTLTEGINRILVEAINQYGTATEVRHISLDSIAPMLNVENPIEGLVTSKTTVNVIGVTEVGANLTINGVNVTVAEDGRFLQTISLSRGENIITITSIDNARNQSVITRNVTLQLGKKNTGGGTGGGNGKGNRK